MLVLERLDQMDQVRVLDSLWHKQIALIQLVYCSHSVLGVGRKGPTGVISRCHNGSNLGLEWQGEKKGQHHRRGKHV